MFLDSQGLITQANGDEGDTLQREGFWAEGVFWNPITYPNGIAGMAPYKTALQELTDPDGNLERGLNQYSHQNDPNDVSRDQLVSNIRACGLYGYASVNKRILSNCIKNYSRFPNGDICAPWDYARFARAFKCWWAIPFIWIMDISLVVQSIVSCIVGLDPNQYPEINFVGDLAFAQNRYPSPLSWLARKIYKYCRPGGAMYCISHYFAASQGSNPEFILLWQPTVEKF